MKPVDKEVTEKQLAEDFERIQAETDEKVREHSVEEFPPLVAPEEDTLVVEPVYAYEVHASSSPAPA